LENNEEKQFFFKVARYNRKNKALKSLVYDTGFLFIFIEQYICKTQIDVQSSNPCPISTSQASVLFQILKLASNLWPFLTFWNWRPTT